MRKVPLRPVLGSSASGIYLDLGPTRLLFPQHIALNLAGRRAR